MGTSVGELSVEVQHAGVVAVVESASDSAHYPSINRDAFTAINVPWLVFEFFDESELAGLLGKPLDDHFAAVVFTAGAIQLPGVRTIVMERADVLAQALARGVGLIVTATSLGGLDKFDLSFLPEGGQVSLVETEMRDMTGTVLSDGVFDREIPDTTGHRVRSAVTLASSHALGWTDFTSLKHLDGSTETVTWQAQFGLGLVIVSVLPYERLGWQDVVEEGLIRAARSRGCLVVGGAAAPAWYDEIEPGQFLARLRDPGGDEQALIQMLENFSNLRLCPDVPWSALGYLNRENLLTRLENDGTVEFAAHGPGEPVYARLQGVPRYLIRLRQAQAQLGESVLDLPTSPTFHILAFAILSQTCERVVRGRLFVPDLLRADTLLSVVESAVARRVRNGNVDGLLLPTVNLLAACSIARIESAATEQMMSWVEASAASASPDQRAQARWAARAADRDDLRALIPAPEHTPNSLVGQFSFQLDNGRLDPIPPRPIPGVASDSRSASIHDGVRQGMLSPLDAAMLAYTHARWSDKADPNTIWDVLEGSRRHLASRVSDVGGNVEELCYRTAAAALLDAEAPLTVHPGVSQTPDFIPYRASEQLAKQAVATIDARTGQQAVDDLNKVMDATTRMAGVLASLLGLAGIAMVTLPLWLRQAQGLTPEVRITLAVGAFVTVSTLATLALHTQIVERVSPRWVQAVGRLVGAFRGI